MVICLEQGADLHMAQLMPLPLTASVKSRLVLPFWYRLTRVVLDKGPLNGCVCVCVCVVYLLCCRYLYYTDWGKTASVVRTRLDGSSPTLIKKDLNNPNGIAVVGGKIYVTDSNYRTRVPASARTSMDGSLYSMNPDGSGWTDVLSSAAVKLKV